MQRVRSQLHGLASAINTSSRHASQSTAIPDSEDADAKSDTFGLNSQLMALTFLSMGLTADISRNNANAMKAATDRMAEINRERIESMAQERELRAQEANQVRKGGIVGAVFDWVVAAVDVVVGIGKTIAGVMTANPMLIAGGALTLAAGAAGIGVAFSNTMALVDKGNADQWRERANKASTAQMALGIAATVVDVTSHVSNFARNAVMRGAKSVVKEGGKKVVRQKSMFSRIGDAVEKSVAQSAGQTVRTAGTAAAKQSASTMQHVNTELRALMNWSRRAKTVWRSGGQDALQRQSRTLWGPLFRSSGAQEVLSRQTQRVVKQSVKKVLRDAANEGVEQMTRKEFARAVRQQVQTGLQRVVSQADVWRMRAYLSNGVKTVLGGARSISHNAIRLQSAGLRRDADALNINREVLDVNQQRLNEDRDSMIKQQRVLGQWHTQSMQRAMDAIQERSRVRQAIFARLA